MCFCVRDVRPRASMPSNTSIYTNRPQNKNKQLADEKREAEEELARQRQRHEEEAADLRARIQELLEREEKRDTLEQVGWWGVGVRVGIGGVGYVWFGTSCRMLLPRPLAGAFFTSHPPQRINT